MAYSGFHKKVGPNFQWLLVLTQIKGGQTKFFNFFLWSNLIFLREHGPMAHPKYATGHNKNLISLLPVSNKCTSAPDQIFIQN